MAARKRRETFGALRKLPSGRYQASYVGPDGKRHTAPRTLDTQTDARAWLTRIRVSIADNEWSSKPVVSPATFGEYASQWIRTRVNRQGQSLRASTKHEYGRLLSGPLDAFAADRLSAITPDRVRSWYSLHIESGKVTQTARAYSLLKAVLSTAVSDGLLASNPCMIRGAVKATTGKEVSPPTAAELAIILETIDPRYTLLVQIAAWGGLRWGEVTELRVKDVRFTGPNDEIAVMSVTRAVTYTKSTGYRVGKPKSEAGIRAVALPPHITAEIREHLRVIGEDPEALLFSASKQTHQHLSPGSFAPFWREARSAARRADLPFHALRHYGATRFAQTGATLKEIQARLGHSTVEAAMRYQHEAGRDAELARRMTDII